MVGRRGNLAAIRKSLYDLDSCNKQLAKVEDHLATIRHANPFEARLGSYEIDSPRSKVNVGAQAGHEFKPPTPVLLLCEDYAHSMRELGGKSG